MKEIPSSPTRGPPSRRRSRARSAVRRSRRSSGRKGKPAAELTAAVTVSDITRPVPYRGENGLLRPLLNRLEAAGIPRGNIRIVIGNGMHRPSTAEERDEMFGEEIVRDYPVIDHDCEDADSLTFIGQERNRRRRLREQRLLPGRPPDRHGPRREPLHGRALRRAQGDLPGPRRQEDDREVPQPRLSRIPLRTEPDPQGESLPRGVPGDRPDRGRRFHRERDPRPGHAPDRCLRRGSRGGPRGGGRTDPGLRLRSRREGIRHRPHPRRLRRPEPLPGGEGRPQRPPGDPRRGGS